MLHERQANEEAAGDVADLGRGDVEEDVGRGAEAAAAGNGLGSCLGSWPRIL